MVNFCPQTYLIHLLTDWADVSCPVLLSGMCKLNSDQQYVIFQKNATLALSCDLCWHCLLQRGAPFRGPEPAAEDGRSIFSLSICCNLLLLHRLSVRKKTAPRADQQARAPGGLDFSRVSLGAPLISKADKLSGILKRGKVATVLMARVTPSDLKPGVPP